MILNLIVKFRNSIHNNGVYTNDKEQDSRQYRWNNHNYQFFHGKQIEVDKKNDKNNDLWGEYFRFTREFMYIFENIMNAKEVQSQPYIEDITEPA